MTEIRLFWAVVTYSFVLAFGPARSFSRPALRPVPYSSEYDSHTSH